jgi:hypothetical protein
VARINFQRSLAARPIQKPESLPIIVFNYCLTSAPLPETAERRHRPASLNSCASRINSTILCIVQAKACLDTVLKKYYAPGGLIDARADLVRCDARIGISASDLISAKLMETFAFFNARPYCAASRGDPLIRAS